jgi:uracil-DNA glycosylase
VLDARKSIEVLADEWAGCQKCELHAFREQNETEVLVGGGEYDGIMFIGESPSFTDNRRGTVFSNKESKETLLALVAKLKIRPAYFTYLVGCQSCSYRLTDKGEKETRIDYGGRETYKLIPQAPSVLPVRACKPRLDEEIYIVDPVIIVALGPLVAASLSGKSASINQDRGTLREISIPGVTYQPNLSKKKKEWKRKVKGEYVTPIDQFQVRYSMLITYSVMDVYNSIEDRSPGNAYDAFVQDLFTARRLYRLHNAEVMGVNRTYEKDPTIERPDING